MACGTTDRFPRRRRAAEERGVAITEFALIAPVLMLLVMGMLEFGKAFNYWIDATHLANQGARWAVVNKNPGAGGGMSLQQYIQSEADTPELRTGGTSSIANPLLVCVVFPAGTSNVGDPVEVRVRTSYSWLPIIGNALGGVLSTAITGSATMRIEQPPNAYAAGPGGTGASCP